VTVSAAEARNRPITVGAVTVLPGSSRRSEIPVASLPTGTWLSLPVAIVNGRRPGPTVWLSGVVHGDEINGVAIIRQVMGRLDPQHLQGAVIAVPIVNVFGFVNESRYLPDRRDLNRSFPGSPRGSLAARLAHLVMTEVVEQSDLGIDLHTAAGHNVNIPHIRGDMTDPATRRLATTFGAPFLLHARLRDGSLREAAVRRGKQVLVYEGGQIHRFDAGVIDVGVAGILRTLQSLEMGSWDDLPAPDPSRVAMSSSWVRSRRGGIADILVDLGEHVGQGEPVAVIADAFGSKPTEVRARFDGWVIGRTLNPLVGHGDPLVHLAADAGSLQT